jgi:hypothetical protein
MNRVLLIFGVLISFSESASGLSFGERSQGRLFEHLAEPFISQLYESRNEYTEFYFRREVTPVLRTLSELSESWNRLIVKKGREYIHRFADRYQITTVEAAPLLAVSRYISFVNECRDIDRRRFKSTIAVLEKKYADVFDINASWMTEKIIEGDTEKKKVHIRYIDTILSTFLARSIARTRDHNIILRTIDWLITDKKARPDCTHETTLYAVFKSLSVDQNYNLPQFFKNYCGNCNLLQELAFKNFSLFTTQKSVVSFADSFLEQYGRKIVRASSNYWIAALQLASKPLDPAHRIAAKGIHGYNNLHRYFHDNQWREDHDLNKITVLLKWGVDPNQKNFDGKTPFQMSESYPSQLPLFYALLVKHGWWMAKFDIKEISKKIFTYAYIKEDRPGFIDINADKHELYRRLKNQLVCQESSLDTDPTVSAYLFDILNPTRTNADIPFIFEKKRLLDIIFKNRLLDEKRIVQLILKYDCYDCIETLKQKSFYCYLDNTLLKDLYTHSNLYASMSWENEQVGIGPFIDKFHDILAFQSEKQKDSVKALFRKWIDLIVSFDKRVKRDEFLLFMDRLSIKEESFYATLDDSN